MEQTNHFLDGLLWFIPMIQKLWGIEVVQRIAGISISLAVLIGIVWVASKAYNKGRGND